MKKNSKNSRKNQSSLSERGASRLKIVDIFASFVAPTRNNRYYPYLLRRTALVIYITFLLIINFLGSSLWSLPSGQVVAGSISTSRLVSLANSERTSRGLGSLKVDSRLVSAAYKKGQDMLQKDYWSHYGPNGETPWQFILSSGYAYVYAGENLAKDFSTADAVHSAWMASATHRANILKPQYKDIGIAVVTGDFSGKTATIVVQMFGSQSSYNSTATNSQYSSNSLPSTGKTKSAKSSSSKPAPKPPSPPVISEPQNGTVTGNVYQRIKGTTSGNNEISVFDNGSFVGSLNAEGGVFDYRPENEW